MSHFVKTALEPVGGAAPVRVAAPRRVSDTPLFTAVFASTIDAGEIASPVTRPAPKAVAPAAKPSPTLKDALDSFRKEARMTPRERIRRDVLKENRLTEEGLAAMAPKEHDAAEKKIKAEVDRRLAAIEEEARRKGKAIGLAAML